MKYKDERAADWGKTGVPSSLCVTGAAAVKMTSHMYLKLAPHITHQGKSISQPQL